MALVVLSVVEQRLDAVRRQPVTFQCSEDPLGLNLQPLIQIPI